MQYASERLWNVLKTSSKLVNKNSITWWYVLKASWRHLCKTSWRCLEDVLNTSSKRLEDVLKMSWRCFWRRLEKVLKTFLQDVLKTFWRHLGKTSWRRLLKTYEYSEYIRLDQDVFIKTNVCWARIQFRTLLNGWRVLESISPEIFFKTIQRFPKHDTGSNQPQTQRIFSLGTRLWKHYYKCS